MAFIDVKITGINELKASLKAEQKRLEKGIDDILARNVEAMSKNAKRDAPVDQATLRQGIQPKKNKPLDYVLTSNAYHSAFIEFGTKSRFQPIPGVDASEFKSTGANKSGKGFYDSILDWVKRNGIAGTYSIKTKRRVGSKIDKQIEDEQTAFAIYLSIIRHGIKPHPFFFKQAQVQEQILSKDVQNFIASEQRL